MAKDEASISIGVSLEAPLLLGTGWVLMLILVGRAADTIFDVVVIATGFWLSNSAKL